MGDSTNAGVNSRALLVFSFFFESKSVITTQQQFRIRLNVRWYQLEELSWVDRLRASGAVLNEKPSGHPRIVTAPENVVLAWWPEPKTPY